MKRHVAFIHTAHAAIPPLMQYYSAAAPTLDITNLLDEGILRFFSSGNYNAAEWRFRDLISIAKNAYRAEAAVITCSSAPLALVSKLGRQSTIPVMKIDVPMATAAVRMGKRIGLAVTFRATLEPTTALLNEAATQAGTSVEIFPVVAEGAYGALLNGLPDRHDALLLAAMDDLVRRPLDVVVLAQVSMARVLPRLRERFSVPVLSSVETSLPVLGQLLG